MKLLQKNSSQTKAKNPIIVIQTPETRALNLGYIVQSAQVEQFLPARLSFGAARGQHTFLGTIQSLQLPEIQKILKKYQPTQISTITLLRETLSCRLGEALFQAGVAGHFGDAFIGATHIKGDGAIRTDYQYENTEGLVPDGLWVIAESLCTGRNISATLNELLPKFSPKEIILIAPIASRRAIETVDAIVNKHKVKITYVAWGGLFGVDEKTLYDMPWGHPDTEAVDDRDRETFVNMYGAKLCMGGDFGNNYYSPTIAKQLYDDQLREHQIKPKFSSIKELLKTYKQNEFVLATKS